jgi:alpha-ribazole phosphatase
MAMAAIQASELVLVRHAPADHGGRLAGRRDVPALLDDDGALDRLCHRFAGASMVVSSPARRCRETAARLFPGRDVPTNAALWEQDFGAHEGVRFEDLPDLGPLDRAALAAAAAPGGESFADMADRVAPALRALLARPPGQGPIVVVAHAGTARAALALALGDVPAALAFEIAPLSTTSIRAVAGTFAIAAVNVPA